MNANSQPPTQAIKDWLLSARQQLVKAGIATAKLDAEIILAHTTRKNRTYLHAHDDELLGARTVEIANARLDLRLDRVPIAYIIGHKDFYGRRFRVTPAVLVPRPESEAIINSLKTLLPNSVVLPGISTTKRLVDVGTGSGCLGITAKLEFPELDVTLLDISQYALQVATENAARLGAEVTILQSDLLAQYPLTADIIIANLPYVDSEWERSPETAHEPEIALFAGNHGLGLINKLISQAEVTLVPHGSLILEADPVQHEAITKRAKEAHFSVTHRDGFALVLVKS